MTKKPLLLSLCLAFTLALAPLPVSAYEDPADLYMYLAKPVRIVDGGRFEADVDLGFGVWKHKIEFRLKGVQTPEVKGETLEAGKAAFEFLKQKFADQERILIRTFWDPKGGPEKWLAVVSTWDDDKQAWISVNQMVIDAGHGVTIEEKE